MSTIKKFGLLGTFVLSLATFTSCKKSFIEVTPPTSLTPAQALIDEAGMATALRGAYAGFRLPDYYGRTVPVLGDVMADNAYVSVNNSGRYTSYNTNTFTVADANVSNFWIGAYTTILRANNIISATLASNANVNQYKGEAYAIRALCYFTLVRYFARPYTDNPDALGVPVITTYNAELYPPRSKVSEVYALIQSDLTQAYSLMTQFTNSTQFSKYAAKGLQAKVYLTMGDYTNAKTAALDVINNSGFSVVTAANYVSFWNNALPRTDKVETLFEISSDANSNNGFDALPNIYSQSGYGDLLASTDLYNTYGAGDTRLGLYSTGTRGGLSAIFVNKFPNTFGTEVSDTKILRLSEIYLIAAEASNKTNNDVDALTYVNYVRTRRSATALVSTGTQLFEDIIAERRRELAFEGDRYLDLQRLKRDVVRSTEYPLAARSIAYSNFRRVLPIPQSELDANPSIRGQQNTGY